ncbi:MAG: double-strand break repair protein AddB [Pseudomonadota bacterium]
MNGTVFGGGDDERAEEAHPQYHIAQLLDRMDAARADVQPWPWGQDRSQREERINCAMAPARFTRNWSAMKEDDRSFDGVKQAQFAGLADEAQGIAIALRGALEIPLRTAALVTPDRDLAQRVVAHLKRWGIQADDSAGRKLSATLPGSLLLALCMAAGQGFAPVALLGLVKHPLVQKGDERRNWLDGARWLDLALRGPRPAPGLDGISQFLVGGTKRQRVVRDRAAAWWRDARVLFEPLASAFRAKSLALPTLFSALRESATQLCGEEAWRGQEGRAVADLIDRIEEFAVNGPAHLAPAGAADLVRDLLDAVAIRPTWGGHHRIFIWGLLEARLQSADIMILGGLNEGSWPQLPAPDPWLAPRIRSTLQLPGLERRIGLAAHDFASALGGKDILITRAVRDAASPTIESRFLLRLNAFSGGLGKSRSPDFARMIDGNDGRSNPARRPAPAPPAAERPKEIRVTEVDRLKADPFAWYARAMMGLSGLDAIDAEPGAAWRGTLIHDVLENWAIKDQYAEGRLIARVEAEFEKPEAHKFLKALWLPQLRQACGWIENQLIELAGEGRKPRLAEAYGRTDIEGVTLIGQADRIDTMPDNHIAIVDYKTGSPPSVKQASQGYALQLGLIGLLAARGGFKDLVGTPEVFEYWKLNRDAKTREFGGVVKASIGRDATETIIDHALRNLIGAINAWINGDQPFIARLHPEWAKYGDYDQLSRLEEWYGR